MLDGYDDHSKKLMFVNSWGREWGDDGRGTMSYDHFRARTVESWVQSLNSSYTLTGKRAIRTPDSHGTEVASAHELAWVTWDILRGEVLNVFEIYDFTNDERMGWAFAVPRDGFLDIEELFVRPRYRSCGYATRLAELVLRTAESLERPMRLWVSYADCGQENRAALDGLLTKLGLSLWNSPERWSAYLGLADSSPHELRPLVMPDRPAMSRGAWKAAKVAILAYSLVTGPSESISAAQPAPDAATVRDESSRSIDDPPASQAPDHDQDEDEVPPGVEYNLVLTAPPSEIIPCMARVVAIVRGRERPADV